MAHNIKINKETINIFLHKNNYIWIDGYYKNNRSILLIKCIKCNKIRKTNFCSIRKHFICRRCKLLKKIKTIVKNKKSEIIFIKEKNKRLYVKIKCKCGNKWKMRTDNIIDGHWCSNCAKNNKRTIKDLQNVVKSKGGILLEKEYINNQTPISIKCNICKQIWIPLPRDITRKDRPKWCPNCSKYKSQKILQKILEKIFNDKAEINYKKFEWLRNKETGMYQEIDIFFKKLKIAVEYDGIQHFRPTDFTGRMKREDIIRNFLYIKKMDKLKNKKIAENVKDIKYFIRFNYKDKLNHDSVIKKLKTLNIKETL